MSWWVGYKMAFMLLNDLLADSGIKFCSSKNNIDIKDITDDSRNSTKACLFILRGQLTDEKLKYIKSAIKKGAVALLGEEDVISSLAKKIDADLLKNITLLGAKTVDQKLAGQIAEKFFDFPSRKLKLIGITGTNGKTTVGYILRHLLNNAGYKTGLIGTIEIDYGAGSLQTAHLTTPGAIEFSRMLSKMVNNNCKVVVAEVSSHALAQGRTAALEFSGALFTNLSGDHLDYHRTIDKYASAKAKLFNQLPADGFAVLNSDDKWSKRMIKNCPAKQIWTALKPTSQGGTGGLPTSEITNHFTNSSNSPSTLASTFWTAKIKQLSATSSKVTFKNSNKSVNINLPLVGKHNVSNALQAFVAANEILEGKTDLIEFLQSCLAPPGRLEVVPNERFPLHGIEGELWHCPTVIVDYAHTQGALENVLSALKPLVKGKLVAVIGCGGDRDKSKRPKMTKVACTLADQVYITSDNPRTEEPNKIIEDMLEGVPEQQREAVTVQANRAAAIHSAINSAVQDDCVLIAGKGHEDYQIIGKKKIHFDDREQAIAALAIKSRARNERSE